MAAEIGLGGAKPIVVARHNSRKFSLADQKASDEQLKSALQQAYVEELILCWTNRYRTAVSVSVGQAQRLAVAERY